MHKENRNIFITEAASVKDALKKLDETAMKVLLVRDDENRLLGTVTDGDIRRYILSGKNVDSGIGGVYNRNAVYIRKEDSSIDVIKKVLLENKIELVPLLDAENRIIDFITWDQAFSGDDSVSFKRSKVDVPVVIMAGGKGLRLEPFTKIIPKALIPIGKKTIVEVIIDEFRKQGVRKYYLTLNHKSDMIKSYFKDIDKDYEISFITENDYLGTAGSLKLLGKRVSGTFIVSNCDIIVRADFDEVLTFHRKQKAVLTILSSIQHYKIPYGIIKFREGGEVREILEKPEYTFTINAGVYILDKETLDFIPRNSYIDMTDLIKVLIKNGKKVVMYPVNEKDYIDIGQWEEYKAAVEKLRLLK